MKIYIPIILTALLSVVAATGCNKGNQSPSCIITLPTDGQEITKGETINIIVEANDSDGNVDVVSFYIDNVEKESVSTDPYNYNWETNNESIGTHILKAISNDNEGSSTSHEITVVIIDNDGTFTDPRDGKTYNIVEIGNQTWFAENLNYETANSWCYEDNLDNCNTYGKLYKWDAATTACPNGWHLPSDDEWKVLEMHLGMSPSAANNTDWQGNNEGEKLKSTSGWDNNGNGINSSGFAALPGGYLKENGIFYRRGTSSHMWSSSQYSDSLAWCRDLSYDNKKIYRVKSDKNKGRSVRCIKD